MNQREIKIRKWLLDKGIRQRDVASELDVHPALIYYWITGKRRNKAIGDKFLELGLPIKLIEKEGK